VDIAKNVWAFEGKMSLKSIERQIKGEEIVVDK
jgi:hypothetical protein